MKIELRWFKSVDSGNYKLQFREAYYEEWEEVPFILEGNKNESDIIARADEAKEMSDESRYNKNP